MRISNLPENFAPAYCQCLYEIEGLEEGSIAEIEISGADNTVLGIKRMVATDPLVVNISGYLRPGLDPQPIPAGRVCRFVSDPGRTVSGGINIEGIESEERTFTAGIQPINELMLLSRFTTGRRLARGETDELSFAVPSGVELSAVVRVKGAVELDVPVETVTTQRDSIMTLVIEGGHIDEMARAAGIKFGDCTQIEVGVMASDELVCRVEYAIVDEAADRARLCWINPLGCIDYFTFGKVLEKKASVSRSSIFAGESNKVVSLSGGFTLKLNGGYNSGKITAALCDIIFSPRVWLLENGVPRDVEVITENATVASESLSCFILTIKEPEHINYTSL